MQINQAWLKEHLDYKNGNLYLKKPYIDCNNREIGSRIGIPNDVGYYRVSIYNKIHYIHRMVWVWFHGDGDYGKIQHKDKNKENNRIENLVEKPCRKNISKPVRTKPRGVRPTPSGKFAAMIGHLGKTIWLGTFATADEASAAYNKASAKYYVCRRGT